MTDLSGRVALVTGAARGQGRSHAVALATAGADVIGIDLCHDMPEVNYPLASEADLAETAAAVRATGRRIITLKADVRDAAAVRQAVTAGCEEFGGLDIVVANAGIITMGRTDVPAEQVFGATIAVNLVGVWNTLEACVPVLVAQGRGGSIILTSSTAGIKGKTTENTAGAQAYVASKHGVTGLMLNYAQALGSHRIRVNSVHPTTVRTPMVVNEATARAAADRGWDWPHLLPVDMVEPGDVSAAVVWLASDDARYVTGVRLPIDAGFCA